MQTIAQAAADLANGATTARKLVEACLERIEDPAGEGARTFLRVYGDEARASADAMDGLRKVNRHPSRFAGIPISLKDLFDVAGEMTAAGSKARSQADMADEHAPVVQRLLAAGFVPVGPHQHDRVRLLRHRHQPAPRHPSQPLGPRPQRRNKGHVPGGSSSGAAVSVADGMAFMGLGTDTGGSCRIPAAFCGVVGYKPTARRVPITGVLPLSPSLDSVGPLARSVQCCATVDAVLAGEAPRTVPPRALRGLRLAVPGNIVMDGMDPSTTEAFGRALNRLDNLGVRITHMSFPQFEDAIAGQQVGRLCGGRGACLAPRADGRPGRSIRPPRPQPDRARRGDDAPATTSSCSRSGPG